MKKKIASIRAVNWGLMRAGSWRETKWIIYDDFSLEKEKSYNLSLEDIKNNGYDMDSIHKGRVCKKNIVLKESEINDLISLFDNCIHKNYISRGMVCDGVAWEFEYYKNGELLWNRQLGHIYSINELERITSFVSKY